MSTIRLGVIVPVSPFEPTEILLRSANHLKSLDYGSFKVKIVYVVDRKGENDDRAKALRSLGVEVIERDTTRGKRAGAINDALKYLASFKPNYVAIFDVDSRPDRDFVIKCVEALEKNPKAYIASSPRYISNPVNLVSQTIEMEYHMINFLLKRSGFKQFNGLIGVLRADLLMKYRLREDAITEDADFATRMHCLGYEAIYVKDTKIYEQAPLSWKDLISQRKRWYYGGLQLWKYRRWVFSSGNRDFILSWISALTLTYAIILLLPFLLLAPPIIFYRFRSFKKVLVTFGLFVHTVLLQYSAIHALAKYLRGRGMEWSPIKRAPL